MVTRIAHVCIHAKRLDDSIKFYHDALGLKVKFRFIKDGKVVGLYFLAGEGNYIEVFENPSVQSVNTGITHFCLEVDSIDTMVKRLAKHGITATPKELGCDQSFQSWITDPDGTKIELHEYTPKSAQKAGGDVQASW